MPGPLASRRRARSCAPTAGRRQPTVPNPRVLVSGQPTVTITAPYVVAGCAFRRRRRARPLRHRAMDHGLATRVLSNGQPLVLFDSQAICAPTGTPVSIIGTQMRVIGM